jgi:hypothetical protein
MYYTLIDSVIVVYLFCTVACFVIVIFIRSGSVIDNLLLTSTSAWKIIELLLLLLLCNVYFHRAVSVIDLVAVDSAHK